MKTLPCQIYTYSLTIITLILNHETKHTRAQCIDCKVVHLPSPSEYQTTTGVNQSEVKTTSKLGTCHTSLRHTTLTTLTTLTTVTTITTLTTLTTTTLTTITILQSASWDTPPPPRCDGWRGGRSEWFKRKSRIVWAENKRGDNYRRSAHNQLIRLELRLFINKCLYCINF